MSLRNRFVLLFTLLSLAFLIGCGSSSNNPTPPPTGAFSNTNFNGTYTFSVAGSDGNGFFEMAGSLVACGCSAGTISGGAVDLADPAGVAPASTIGSNSTYKISSDGRGTASLSITTTSNVVVPVTLDFVLTSSSHGLVIRYDGSGTGSGTLDLQPSAISQTDLDATPYAFSISGGDLVNTTLTTVGALTLNSSGTITTGVEDFNYGGTPTTQQVLSGSVLVGSGTTPGVATLNTTFGNFTFDVYAIDATHLKLIESDGQAVMVGDLLSQPSTTVPSGNLVFQTGGIDTSGNLFVTAGLVASDGASILSNGSQDINDAGNVDGGTTTPFAFSGTFSATGGGRFLATLTGFQGGSLFAAYPSSGGVLLMEVDTLNGGNASGVALTQQSGAAIAASVGYGFNMTGEDVLNNVELDEIAEFKTTSSSISGLIDVNDGGQLGTSNFTGSYTTGTGGFGTATLNTGVKSMFFYAVDSSTILFISTDPNQAALGAFQVQTTPTSAQSLTQRPVTMPMLRVMPRSRSGLHRGGNHIAPRGK